MNEGIILSSNERDWVIIYKGGCKLLVAISHKCMLAISLSHEVRKGTKFVPYVYVGSDDDGAYERYLHFLGKMCLKPADSKYFRVPKLDEHCKNGHPGDLSVAEWEALAAQIADKVSKVQ